MYHDLTDVYWSVGLVKHSMPILKNRQIYEIIKETADINWYADPFFFSIDDKEIVFFVEEYLVSKHKGILSRLVVDRKSLKIVSKDILLELETHLSFPYYYHYDGNCYLFPENSASGNLKVYSYNIKESSLSLLGVAVDEPLTDISIIEINKVFYLFGTAVPNENSNALRIFKSDNISDPFTFYQEIMLNPFTARGAGDFIKTERDNEFFRFAQDNTTIYGKGLITQKVIFSEKTKLFQIEEISRQYPCFSDSKIIAMHTYNVLGDWAVVDVKRYKHYHIAKFINFLRYRIVKPLLSR